MKFDLIKIKDRYCENKDSILTEEATKTSIIMPFISALGYDLFNPKEVVPEFIADIGAKKGEKIDYAIIKDSNPIIIIECKKIGEDLDIHQDQLIRYFSCTPAKIAILTNGTEYRFFTDSRDKNKMDKDPFIVFNLLSFNDKDISILQKFKRENFDLSNIIKDADKFLIRRDITEYYKKQFADPDEEFLRYSLRIAYKGKLTEGIFKQYEEIVRESLKRFLSDLVSERIESMNEKISEGSSVEIVSNQDNNGIITTEEEIQGYNIVKGLLCENEPSENINYKDKKTFFGIHYKDRIQNYICKLQFNNVQKKSIVIQDETFEITDLNDIYKYKSKLTESLFVCRRN